MEKQCGEVFDYCHNQKPNSGLNKLKLNEEFLLGEKEIIKTTTTTKYYVWNVSQLCLDSS